MTIDKQKLLQWIEVKKEVCGPPYAGISDRLEQSFKAKSNLLNLLERDIKLGEFDQENGEEVKG
jgi:hypothetical protein